MLEKKQKKKRVNFRVDARRVVSENAHLYFQWTSFIWLFFFGKGTCKTN